MKKYIYLIIAIVLCALSQNHIFASESSNTDSPNEKTLWGWAAEKIKGMKPKSPFTIVVSDEAKQTVVEDIPNAFHKMLKEAPEVFIHSLTKAIDDQALKDRFGGIMNKLNIDELAILFKGTKEQKAPIWEKIVGNMHHNFELAGKEAKKQHLHDAFFDLFLPKWYLAQYGFIFGAAVFAGFNGLYFFQQMIKEYLLLRRPKYLSPLSCIGPFDRWKRSVKNRLRNAPKHTERSITAVAHTLAELRGTKKYIASPLCIYAQKCTDLQCVNHIKLFSDVALALNMDYISVSAVHLLQKTSGIETWNDIVQLVYKNRHSVLIYVDQAELFSINAHHSKKQQELITTLASCMQSSLSIIGHKIILVGGIQQKESLQGPFAQLFSYYPSVQNAVEYKPETVSF